MRKVDEANPLTGLVYLTRALELETDPDRIRSHRIRIGEILQRSPRLVGLWRHESTIHMLAISSRGLVASGSTDGLVSIRDLATTQPRGASIIQGSVIWDGEFSPDGGTLAVASEDGRVRLWNPADGRLVKELPHHSSVVDIVFSPDGASLGTICGDGAVRVWDVRRGTIMFAGKHAGEGRRIEFSHSGAVVATAGEDGARLWRMPGGAPLGGILAHGPAGVPISRSRATTGGWRRAAGIRPPACGMFEPPNKTAQMVGHDAGVTGVSFVDDAGLLVTTSIDGTTRTWRVPEGTPTGTPRVSTSIAHRATVNRNLLIATATQGGPVDLWSLQGGRAAPSLPHGGQVTGHFDPDGPLSRHGRLRGSRAGLGSRAGVGRTPEARCRRRGLLLAGGRVTRRHLGSDLGWQCPRAGRHSRAGCRERSAGDTRHALPRDKHRRRVFARRAAPGERRWSRRRARVGFPGGEPLTPPLEEDMPLHFATYAPGGETFAIGGGSAFGRAGAARIRNADGAPRTDLLRHGSILMGASFSPDGTRLLTSAEEHGANVKVWNAATGRLAWEASHGDGVWVSIWSATGARVPHWRPRSTCSIVELIVWCSRGNDNDDAGNGDSARRDARGRQNPGGDRRGSVQLADLSLGAPRLSMTSHKGFVYQAVFSPDGALALTSAGDSTARLWDGTTGEPLTPGLPAGAISRSAGFLRGGAPGHRPVLVSSSTT